MEVEVTREAAIEGAVEVEIDAASGIVVEVEDVVEVGRVSLISDETASLTTVIPFT